MTDIILLEERPVCGETTQTVNARDLHQYLEVGRDFSNWIKARIKQYCFEEGRDFVLIRQNGRTNERGGDRRSIDYHLTLDMAKELAMVERTERGRQARRYFIECERRLQEQQAKALASAKRQRRLPPPGLTGAVRSAVNRKAHELSLRGYDTIRDHLTTWAEQWQRTSEEYAMEQIEDYDGLAGEMVFINAETLWRICSGIGVIETAIQYARSGIRKLEDETNRQWINRVDG